MKALDNGDRADSRQASSLARRLQLPHKMPKTLFLFKSGRKSRLAGNQKHPTELFYGYVQLERAGGPVDIIEENDLGLTEKFGTLWRLASVLSHLLIGVHLWAVWRLGRPEIIKKLNAFDTLVATTTTYGMAISLLKRLGLVRSRVIFVAMGIGDLTRLPWRRWACGQLFRDVEVMVISKGEARHLRGRLRGKVTVGYMPFGVDDGFWTPATESNGAGYVLSIGNDLHRDYATLIKAWKLEFPPLKVVTRLPMPAHGPNVEVIAGDWRRQILSDEEIRHLIRGALFVVLPLSRTVQPSGQSVCLQAMACGKAVVISEVEGLWDRDSMVDGKSCVLVPPGSSDALRAAVEQLLADPEKARAIGAQARRVVEQRLNVSTMATEMERLLSPGPPGTATLAESGGRRSAVAEEGRPAS